VLEDVVAKGFGMNADHDDRQGDSGQPPRADSLTNQARPTRRWRWGCVLAVALLVLGARYFLLPAVYASREAARRSQCRNNMYWISLALHRYHDTYGCFPPAFLADENGRPMHSWRVLILPFADGAAIYNDYRFDEPWMGRITANWLRESTACIAAPATRQDGERPTRR